MEAYLIGAGRWGVNVATPIGQLPSLAREVGSGEVFKNPLESSRRMQQDYFQHTNPVSYSLEHPDESFAGAITTGGLLAGPLLSGISPGLGNAASKLLGNKYAWTSLPFIAEAVKAHQEGREMDLPRAARGATWIYGGATLLESGFGTKRRLEPNRQAEETIPRFNQYEQEGATVRGRIEAPSHEQLVEQNLVDWATGQKRITTTYGATPFEYHGLEGGAGYGGSTDEGLLLSRTARFDRAGNLIGSQFKTGDFQLGTATGTPYDVSSRIVEVSPGQYRFIPGSPDVADVGTVSVFRWGNQPAFGSYSLGKARIAGQGSQLLYPREFTNVEGVAGTQGFTVQPGTESVGAIGLRRPVTSIGPEGAPIVQFLGPEGTYEPYITFEPGAIKLTGEPTYESYMIKNLHPARTVDVDLSKVFGGSRPLTQFRGETPGWATQAMQGGEGFVIGGSSSSGDTGLLMKNAVVGGSARALQGGLDTSLVSLASQQQSSAGLGPLVLSGMSLQRPQAMLEMKPGILQSPVNLETPVLQHPQMEVRGLTALMQKPDIASQEKMIQRTDTGLLQQFNLRTGTGTVLLERPQELTRQNPNVRLDVRPAMLEGQVSRPALETEIMPRQMQLQRLMTRPALRMELALNPAFPPFKPFIFEPIKPPFGSRNQRSLEGGLVLGKGGSSGRQKGGARGRWADLLSVMKSQKLFGVATHPSVLKRPYLQESENILSERMPTVELLGRRRLRK